MDEIRKELEKLFEDMLTEVKGFKKKTYVNIFEEGHAQYRETMCKIAELCGSAEGKGQEMLIEELASVIPDYALSKMQGVSKGKKERLSIDYNMNMAVYVVPLFNYSKDIYCEKIARRMVAIWNEKKVSSLNLSYSSYDDIAGGFKDRPCYITTAVCSHKNMPDDCYELTTLRNYRDDYLMQTEEGKHMVEEYYDTAPGIVMAVNMQKDAGVIYDSLYETYLTPCIRLIEEGRNKDCQDLYTEMVNHLQSKYLYS